MKARGQLDVTLPSVTTAASPARSARGRRRSTAQHDTAALDSLKLESQILRQVTLLRAMRLAARVGG